MSDAIIEKALQGAFSKLDHVNLTEFSGMMIEGITDLKKYYEGQVSIRAFLILR